jgi:hypothetical protein
MNPYDTDDDGFYNDETEYEARMAYRAELEELDYDPTDADDTASMYGPDAEPFMYGEDPPDAEEWE